MYHSPARHFRFFLAPLLLAIAGGLGSPDATAAPLPSVELHAHLFMNRGMTWMFRGDFHGPLKARSWKDRLSSQANPETVERSGIRILVASLYANSLFSLDLRDSVRSQIRDAERFVSEHPNWIIAKSASEAEAALSRGKKVMILSLEGAAGVIETENDIREFVDEKGVRIVTLLHLMDDRFGGVAFLKGHKALVNPFSLLKSLFAPQRDEGVRINPRGLTPMGAEMTRALARRGVWIDLAHASDQAQEELIPILKEANQALLYTHTSLRRWHGAERGLSESQMEAVRETGGIVGLMPSEEMLNNTPASPCRGGVHALSTHYTYLSEKIGSENVMLGSDYNGGIRHLRPSCGTGTSLDEKPGLWNISQASDVWTALGRTGAPTPADLDVTVKRFLAAWARVSP